MNYKITDLGKLQADIVVQQNISYDKVQFFLSLQQPGETSAKCTSIPIDKDAAISLARVFKGEKLCTIF